MSISHLTNTWQVYFDTNKTIRETFGEAGYPVPEQRYSISQVFPNGIDPAIKSPQVTH